MVGSFGKLCLAFPGGAPRRGGGAVVGGAEAVEEGLEIGGILDGEDGVAGGEVVGATVMGDFGLALGGTGAGGAEGVAAIGVEL